MCKTHVGRNTVLVAELSALISAGQDHSLEAIQVLPEQAVSDLVELKELIHTSRPEDQSRLEEMYLRYSKARKPDKGKIHDVAYHIRNLLKDR